MLAVTSLAGCTGQTTPQTDLHNHQHMHNRHAATPAADKLFKILVTTVNPQADRHDAGKKWGGLQAEENNAAVVLHDSIISLQLHSSDSKQCSKRS